MQELLRTNDIVFLSLAEAVLRQAGLSPVIMDQHMSVMDGSIGALPRRLMAPDAEADQARRILDALRDGDAGA